MCVYVEGINSSSTVVAEFPFFGILFAKFRMRDICGVCVEMLRVSVVVVVTIDGLPCECTLIFVGKITNYYFGLWFSLLLPLGSNPKKFWFWFFSFLFSFWRFLVLLLVCL